MTDKSSIRILFMGTPDIAADSLKQLIDDGYNIVGVYTREDKPVGRKQILTPTPVKVVALENGIPVYQPKTLKNEYGDLVAKINPDMIVVVAYGRILPKKVIDVPKYGCVNLHVSLLPKYRGAAPIQWAIINGEKQTGVTIMRIDEGLDTGDIIDVLPVDIDAEENREELFAKVSCVGKTFLSKTLEKIISGDYMTTSQDDSRATYAPQLTKEMADFDFTEDALTLHNKIRGQYPWPGASFTYQDKKVKVLKSKFIDLTGVVGEVLSTKPLIIATSNNALQLITVQPDGGKAMDGSAWAMGKRLKIGDIIN